MNVKGTAAGGGYELALACDEILLVDDRSSAVSLPEVPLLGVLPGTGGTQRLARLVGSSRAIELMVSGEMFEYDVAAQLDTAFIAGDGGAVAAALGDHGALFHEHLQHILGRAPREDEAMPGMDAINEPMTGI